MEVARFLFSMYHFQPVYLIFEENTNILISFENYIYKLLQISVKIVAFAFISQIKMIAIQTLVIMVEVASMQ